MREAKEISKEAGKIRNEIRQEIFLVYLESIESRIDSEEIIWEFVVFRKTFEITYEGDLEDKIKKINQKHRELLHIKELQLEEEYDRLFDELEDEAFERVKTHLNEFGWNLMDDGDCWIVEEAL